MPRVRVFADEKEGEGKRKKRKCAPGDKEDKPQVAPDDEQVVAAAALIYHVILEHVVAV